MIEEYSDYEKKIHEAIFENSQNEYSEDIKKLNSLFANEIKISSKFKSSDEFIQEFEKVKSLKKSNTKVNSMNKILIGAAAAVILIVGGYFGFASSKQEVQVSNLNELKAKVVFVIGDVKVKNNLNEAGTKPETGSLLTKNQILITGDKGTADLQFSNNSTLRIRPNSEISIKRLLEQDGKLTEEVNLKKGSLVANINKQKQTDNFNVVTPTVIAGVRGTRFLITVDPNKNKDEVTKVSVLDGSVGITKHKDEAPLTTEPVVIIDGKEAAQETSKGGDFLKSSITQEDIDIIEGKETTEPEEASETEQSLFKKYGRLEVLSLDGGSKITGVITSMNDDEFTVHTTKGFVKVDRKKVISHDSKQLK